MEGMTTSERGANENGKWVALGVVIGLIAAGSAGVVVVNLLIPWEDICAALGPAQIMAETGSTLITELLAWLDKARVFDHRAVRPSNG